eukprot:gene10894-13330_t
MSPGKLSRLKPQPAATPEAWLDRMAADVGRLQVENLLEVQQALAQQALDRAAGALAGDLNALATAQQQLDFSLLQTRGWWARTTGKARSAGAEFAAQVLDTGFEALGQALAGLEFTTQDQVAQLNQNGTTMKAEQNELITRVGPGTACGD